MNLLHISRRLMVFVLILGAMLLVIAPTTRGEKVRKPAEGNKEGKTKKAEVYWGSGWYPAEIIEEKDGKFHIRYDGYSDSSNEWVGEDRIRFPAKAKAATSKKAEVHWGSKWYPAEVLEEKDGKFHIKYDGYDDTSNEWVGKDRIRFAEKPAAAKGLGKPEVEWNGTWYPAVVLETKDGKFFIKYDGYNEQWNEWVGKDRIRFPETAKPTGKPGKSGNKDQDEKQPNGQN